MRNTAAIFKSSDARLQSGANLLGQCATSFRNRIRQLTPSTWGLPVPISKGDANEDSGITYRERRHSAMKALVWHGKEDVRYDTVSDPALSTRATRL
jgi:hypothetical protein